LRVKNLAKKSVFISIKRLNKKTNKSISILRKSAVLNVENRSGNKNNYFKFAQCNGEGEVFQFYPLKKQAKMFYYPQIIRVTKKNISVNSIK